MMTKREKIYANTQNLDFLNTLLNLDMVIPEGTKVYDEEGGGYIDLVELIHEAQNDFIHGFCK